MRPQPLACPSNCVGWVGGALLFVFTVLAVGAPSDAQTDTQAQSLAKRRLLAEHPDDPPGVPARAHPGSRAAVPVDFGPFAHMQVNVAPGGIDIVGDAANEPSIAVDPTAPNRLAIGWRQFGTIASNFREAGYAWSNDGGREWISPGVLEPGVFRSDPVLSFDMAGNFYYNSLTVSGSQYICSVFRSPNGGIWWSPPVFAYGGDKCWMNVDRTGGPSDGHIYTVCSIFGNNYTPLQCTRSTDGGESYEYPVAIEVNTTYFSPIWGTLDVAPNGDLYVGGIHPNDASIFYVARSSTAKDPLVTPTWDSVTQVDLGGNITYTLGTSPNPGGLLGQVSLAVDQTTSGPTAGNIYLLASVDPPGADPLDVRFAQGTNNGLTWNNSVRVNKDPGNNGAWQWFGTMSVAPNGRIDVVWNDTRNTSGSNESQLFYSSSSDGGATWTADQQVSPTFDSYLGWPNQSKIGDYYDSVSDDVGAHLAWAATFTGGQDVYYVRIGDYDCNSNGVADSVDIAMGTSPDSDFNGIPDECDQAVATDAAGPSLETYRLHQNMPNPFNPTTTIRFDTPFGGGRVALRVYDTAGRLVRTLVDGFEPGGVRFVDWDGRDQAGKIVASGVYFCRLDGPGFSESRKLVFLK